MEYLNMKDRKSIMSHINKLLEIGLLSRTIPDKPRSKYQKYVTINQ